MVPLLLATLGITTLIFATVLRALHTRLEILEADVAKLRADHHSIPVPYIPHPVYPTKHPPR